MYQEVTPVVRLNAWGPMLLFAVIALVAFAIVKGRSEGFAMRRYLWGVLLLLGAMTLVAHPVVVTRVETPRSIVVMPPPPPEFVQAPAPPQAPWSSKPPANPAPPSRQAQTVSRKGHSTSKPVEDPTAIVWESHQLVTKFLPNDAAYEEAHDAVRSHLMHELHLNVVPTLEFITQSKWMTLTWEGPEKAATIPEVDGLEVIRLRVKASLTAAGWRELEQRERSYLRFQRIEGTARGLMALTVLLGVVAGYIRLDEWSKGYYTGRLRLAAVVLVAAAGLLVVG
jgi:hypothetical protein